MKRVWVLLGVGVLLAAPLRADELRLKDGSKIVGTIVGFDDASFKVKTSYGFAVVRRDEVVSIIIKDVAGLSEKKAAEVKELPAPGPTTAPTPAASGEKSQPAPAASVATTSASSPSPSPKSEAKSDKADAKSAVATAPKPNSPSPGPAATAMKSAPTPAPAKPSEPEPVRENISGNTYTNDTYGFRMYKPPAWDLIEGARSVLPGAIAALGTSDETTYLLIGTGTSAGSMDADANSSDRKLKEMLENYRPVSDKHTTIAGLPAIERHFRGAVDNKDWSGIVVVFERGKDLYTVLGMTYAASDLVQIQENVIHRAITSIEFTR